MTDTKPKWRIVKKSGMWIVRQPGGAHFGAYFTWREAMAQSTRRAAITQAGQGGYFDRRSSWGHDDRIWGQAFGFVGPVRSQTVKEIEAS